jgi:DNA processing protein
MIALTQVRGFGPVTIKKLMEHFHRADLVWKAKREDFALIPGIRAKAIEAMHDVDWDKVKAQYKQIHELNIHLVSYGDPNYPSPLATIYDPPSLLYMQGQWLAEDGDALAIVGTRRASQYGIRCAYQFGRALAERHITMVSGLAVGVDIAAHRGVLAGKGRTIAVLGSGLGHLYPPQHSKEAKSIAANGAVVSEYPVDTAPLPINFPKRNRIISGLSLGIIVIEAGAKSGALITAHIALEQGREVFALPGAIDNEQNKGTHRLIQEGAKLVTDIDDVLEEILSLQHKIKKKVSGNLPLLEKMACEEKQIWELLDAAAPQSIEAITNKTTLDPSVVSSTLLKMEMKGFVNILPGQRYTRKNI